LAKKSGKFTATGIAAVRAAAFVLENDPNIKNPDYLAITFLPISFRIVFKIRPLLWLIFRNLKKRLPGNYYLHIVRTKHIDNILEHAVNTGLQQLVILGAGLDTRAYRFKNELRGIKVFEVDYPDTQSVKRERLTRLKTDIPTNVTYVPIDFNTQRLEILLEKGYLPTLNTLFIWEGVCMYISPESVDQVLSFVTKNSGHGSNIVFDYIFQSMVEGKCDYYGARESAKYAAKVGEPYIFGIEEGKIREFLENRGLNLLSEYTPKDLEQTYLKTKNGKIRGKVCEYTNFVHASII